MTEVVFEDVEGRRGHITEGLEVDYQGSWGDVVRTCVERIGRGGTPGVEPGVTDDVYGTLILELTEVAPIVCASRVDGRRTAGPDDGGLVEAEPDSRSKHARSPAGSG